MHTRPLQAVPVVGQVLLKKISLALIVWISIWVFISGLLVVKIPAAFSKVYAEDGLALQVALEKSFPHDFLLPYAGYFDVVWRSGGRVAAMLPLEYASQTFFFFNTLMLSWIALTVFHASSEFIHSRVSRAFFSLSLVFLPIASFESIANTTNLHFFFMSACLPIFLRKGFTRYETYTFSFFVLVATLSTPLMIFYFPLIVFLRWSSKFPKRLSRPKLTESAWVVGILFQTVFILTFALGDRTSLGINSIGKSSYLYLDRVVGSTLIPWWGNVSQGTPSIAPNLFPAPVYLGLRALFAFAILSLLLLWIVKSTSKKSEVRVIATGVLLTGFFYWLIVGTLFNPEPRYAIYPSFGLLLILFYSKGGCEERRMSKSYFPAMFTIILLTWIGSWNPSSLRVNGPTWISEYKNAQVKCQAQGGQVSIPIIPTNLDWFVTIDCKKITPL